MKLGFLPLSLSTLALSAAIASPALAQGGRPAQTAKSTDVPTASNEAPGTEPAEASGTESEEITVTGRRFLSVDTSGTTNLPIPIEKVPQSISLVSGDFIKAANLETLGGIAEYTAGATNAGDPGGNGTVVRLRGFSAGQAIDGLTVNVSNGTSYEPEFAIFERLEVVKGPTSVVYGVSSPGGLVNKVTKSATPQTAGYLLAQAGNWNNYRVEGQVAGSLDSADRIRAIGLVVRDAGDSFMQVQTHANTTVYAGINADLGDSATAYLHGGYQKFVRNPFDGMPTLADGSSAPVPRSFFIGSPNIKTTSTVRYAVGDLTWDVTDLWEVSIKGNYENGENKGASAFGFGLQPNGNISLSAFNLNFPGAGTDFQNYAIGASSIYKLDALGMRDSFVSVAALYQDNRSGFRGASPPPGPATTGNIFNGVSSIGRILESLLAAAATQPPFESRRHVTNYILSAQALLKLADPFTVLLGVARSKPHTIIRATSGVRNFEFDGQISLRAGVTYEFVPSVNAYVSFSQSFSPQTNNAIDANGVVSPLPPLEGEMFEGGLKYRSRDGQFLATGSLFEIKQKNQGQFDRFLNGVNYFAPIGEVTHKGFELEAVGRITSQWQVNAGFAYLDAKVTKDLATLRVGQRRTFLPDQTWSLFTTYALPDSLLPGLTVGGGVRHVSSQRTAFKNAAGVRPTKDLPGYTLVDATVSYEFDKWLLQVNGGNIFDKHYLVNNYQSLTFGNVVGTPRNITLTIRREF